MNWQSFVKVLTRILEEKLQKKKKLGLLLKQKSNHLQKESWQITASARRNEENVRKIFFKENC